MTKRAAIIGGGISGLCTAYLLQNAGIEVTLYEKNNAVGGNIRTEHVDGFLLEHGPNSMLVSRQALDLIGMLGLESEIAASNPVSKNRFILRDGKLVALPSKIVGLVTTKVFSAGAKLRLLAEPFIRGRASESESVADFFRRRLGREIADYAVDPFISGIYAGDPAKLSIKQGFPRLFDLEKNHGSLLRGALFAPKDKNAKLPKGTPRSISFKNGMQTITDKLAEKLGTSIKLNTTVTGITINGPGSFTVTTETGGDDFDAVVISTPFRSAAELVHPFDTGLADRIANIYSPPVTVVFTAFKTAYVGFAPDGFGFLVPALENRRILGTLWTSSAFDGRAPEGLHLFTTFVGGARNADLALQDESAVIEMVIEELQAIMQIDAQPEFTRVKAWSAAIPQYDIGYKTVVDGIRKFEQTHPGIFFCSNFYRGISVADCIKNSFTTSAAITELLE